MEYINVNTSFRISSKTRELTPSQVFILFNLASFFGTGISVTPKKTTKKDLRFFYEKGIILKNNEGYFLDPEIFLNEKNEKIFLPSSLMEKGGK